MGLYLTGWAAASVVLLAIDAVWLGWLARDFYFRQLGPLMREEISFAVAAVFYIFYSLAVVILVSMPMLKNGAGVGQVLLFGAILGLCAYGTYDITNLATLKGWPSLVSMVDWAWGTVLTGTVAMLAYFVTRATSGN